MSGHYSQLKDLFDISKYGMFRPFFGRTMNIIQGRFIIVDDMKPVDAPRVRSFNVTAPLCVRDAIWVVIL